MTKLRNLLARIFARNETDEKSPPSVKIGDGRVAVRPVGIEGAIRLALLIAPYMATFQRYSGEISAAVALDHRRNGNEPSTLRAVVTAMTQDLEHAPGDVIEIVSIFLDQEPEWVAQNATAAQVVAALPAIDAANDLAALVRCTGLLGFIPGQPVAEGDQSDGSERKPF